MRWAGGKLALIALPGGALFFTSLTSSGQGALAELAAKFPPLMREQGYSTGTLFNDDPGAAKWLAGVGFERDEPGHWRCSFAEGCRLEQYAAWKAGTAAEPGWRSQS